MSELQSGIEAIRTANESDGCESEVHSEPEGASLARTGPIGMTKKKAKAKKKTRLKGNARFVSFTKAANSPLAAKAKTTQAEHKKHRKRLTKFLDDAKLALSDARYHQMMQAASDLSDADNALYHRLYTAMHNRPWGEPD